MQQRYLSQYFPQRLLGILVISIGVLAACGSVPLGSDSPEDYANEQQAVRDLAIPPDLMAVPSAPLLAVPDLPEPKPIVVEIPPVVSVPPTAARSDPASGPAPAISPKSTVLPAQRFDAVPSTSSAGSGSRIPSASPPKPEAQTKSVSTAVPSVSPMRPIAANTAVLSADQRGVIVPIAPDRVWMQLMKFWQIQKVRLVEQNPEVQVLRTAWIPNRERIANDPVTNTLRSFIGGLYESDQRDQYVIRLQSHPKVAQTTLYLTYYGRQQKTIYDRDGDIENTQWVPRAPDPEQAGVMLNRLLAFFNSAALSERQLAAYAVHHPQVTAATDQLRIADSMEVVWSLLEHALQQPMFKIQHRERAQGLFLVQYPLPDADAKGLLSGLKFWRDQSLSRAQQYQIVLQPQVDGTVSLYLLDTQGQPVDHAMRIPLLSRFAGYFRLVP